jgi:hypothetical protein
MRLCVDCGVSIKHGKRCKICSKKRQHEQQRKWKYNNQCKNMFTKLGTTDFDAHRKKNFKDEKISIQKELKKLGLR